MALFVVTLRSRDKVLVDLTNNVFQQCIVQCLQHWVSSFFFPPLGGEQAHSLSTRSLTLGKYAFTEGALWGFARWQWRAVFTYCRYTSNYLSHCIESNHSHRALRLLERSKLSHRYTYLYILFLIDVALSCVSPVRQCEAKYSAPYIFSMTPTRCESKN